MHESSSIYSFILLHLRDKPLRQFLSVAVFFTLCSSVFQVFAAWQLGEVFGGSRDLVWTAAVTWLGLSGLQFLCHSVADLSLVKTSFQISKFWRKHILRLLFLPRETYEAHVTEGDVAARATSDCDGIEREIVSIIERFLFLGVNVITVTVGASLVSVELSVILFLSCLPTLVIPSLFSRLVRKRFKLVAESSSDGAQSTKEILDQWLDLQSLSAEKYGYARVAKSFSKNKDHGISASHLTSTLSSVSTSLAYLPFAAVVLVGLSSFQSLEAVLLIAGIKLAYDISGPLRNAADEIINIHRVSGQLLRIKEGVDLSSEITPVSQIIQTPSLQVQVSVKNLSISIKNDFVRWKSMSFKCGDRVIVRGPSGSGKSTALRSLTGKQKIHSGSIFMSHPNSTRFFGVGLPDFGSDLVETISKVMGLSESMARLRLQKIPGLLDAWNFSSSKPWQGAVSQWAIALTSDTKVVVFDETLSHLSDEEVCKFSEVLRKTGQSVIVFIASHDDRLSGTIDVQVNNRCLTYAED